MESQEAVVEVSNTKKNIVKEIDKDIIIDLNSSSKVELLSTATAERNQMVVSNNKLSLTRCQHYKIPILNKNIDLNSGHFIKVNRIFRSSISVLDVENGYVILTPLVHNTVLKDKDKIGSLI